MALALCLPALGPTVTPARAAVYQTKEEALALAFPDAEVKRRTAVLTDEQMSEVEELAGTRPGSSVAIWYRGTKDGELLGTAWFDAHRVRTLPEVVMIVIDPQGTVMSIEILAFREPPEYLAPPRWLEQFEGRELDRELRIRRAIHGITGATLTARAVTSAVRRALALHAVLENGPPASSRGGAEPAEGAVEDEAEEHRGTP